jgi:hypothetical protein
VTDDPARIIAAILERAGLPPDAVVLADAGPDAKPPPEGPWLVVRAGAQWVVGGMGRGRFAPYEGLWKVTDGLDLAVRLAASPLPVRADSPSEGELEQGRATGTAILERTAACGGSAGPTALEPGELLDVIGPETGHHLYALGTPFPARSQPPSDVGAPYFTFRVAQPLPPTVQEGRAAPWFEQPGGGAMVVLDRPIRWYVDRGYLESVPRT